MLYGLIKFYRQYHDFFEEIGASEDFNELLGKVDELQEPKDHLSFLLKVGEIYAYIEDFCLKYRKQIPPTVLNNLRADITDIIEATPLPPP